MGLEIEFMDRLYWVFVGKSLLRLFLMVTSVCILSFILLSNSPIDPIDAYFTGANVSAEQYVIVASYWGFDKPPIERFWAWFIHLVQGDLGKSFIYHAPVVDIIMEKAQASFLLMGVAWLFSGVIGIFFGSLSGVYKNSLVDIGIRGFSLLTVSIPLFWLGLLILMIFAVKLQWFPLALASPIGKIDNITWLERLHHMALPAITLSITGIAAITLQTREKVIEVMQSNYILFAMARGENLKQCFFRHGLRNILLPAVTLQFASLGELFGGSILAETVFSYPGLGSTVTLAGLRGDLSLLLGVVLISAIIIFAGNFIADILYGLIDPKIREGKDLS